MKACGSAFLLGLLQSAPASSPSASFSLAAERSRPVAKVFDREVTVGEILDRVERRAWPGLGRELDGPYGWFHLHSPLFDRWVDDGVDLLLLEKERPELRVETEEIARVARERTEREVAKSGRERPVPEVFEALVERRRRQDGISIELDLRLDRAIGRLTGEDLRGHYYATALHYGGKVRAAHIFFSTLDPATGARLPASARDAARAKAEDGKRRLDGGADFAELARTLSEDPATIEKGGDLGFFAREGRVPDEVARAAFAGHPGQVVGPVESERGFHLVRILDRQIPREPDFQKVREAVERDLRRERKRALRLDLRKKGAATIY